MNRLRTRAALLLVLSSLSLWYGDTANAGDGKVVVREEKTVIEPNPATPWEFKLAVPGWIAGVSGETGVRGRTSNVDVPASTILSKLNATVSFQAEAHKGRFGIYSDFLYLSAQDGVFKDGLVSKIDIKVNETLTNFDLGWRILQGADGWLELFAGVRYTSIYNRVGLQAEDARITAASVRFIDVAGDQVKSALKDALNGSLDGDNPTLPIAPLTEGREGAFLALINQARADPELEAAIRSGVQARIDKAKADVSQRLARAIQKQLDRNLSLQKAWVDPYVGLRARYNVTKAIYVTGKADGGGFGIGSKVTCQIYAALGCQIARHIFAEAGYRYLYVDYVDGGFTYNVATGGPQITVGVNF